MLAACALSGCLASTPGKTGFSFDVVNSIGLRSSTFQIVEAPAYPTRYGKYSERFEVRPGDCGESPTGTWSDCLRDRERSELLESGESHEGETVWYRWSLYIPEGHENIFPVTTIYGQFFQAPCKRRPAFMFQEYEGGLWFRTYSKLRYIARKRLLTREELAGRWHDIVVHAHWSSGADGFVRVFLNGKQKVDYKGTTFSESGHRGHTCTAMKVKYGVYRSFVSRSERARHVTTVAYYDGMRKSKSKAGMFDPMPE